MNRSTPGLSVHHQLPEFTQVEKSGNDILSLMNPHLIQRLDVDEISFSGSKQPKWQPTPISLPGESQGRGSLVGCRLWGRTESDMTEATEQQQQIS